VVEVAPNPFAILFLLIASPWKAIASRTGVDDLPQMKINGECLRND
jgi:hypothetical protein